MTIPKNIVIITADKEDADLLLARFAGITQKLLLSKKNMESALDEKTKAYATQQYNYWIERSAAFLNEINKPNYLP